MRTAENKVQQYFGSNNIHFADMVKLVKEYTQEALEEAHCKIATLDWNVMNNDIDGQEVLKVIRTLKNELK